MLVHMCMCGSVVDHLGGSGLLGTAMGCLEFRECKMVGQSIALLLHTALGDSLVSYMKLIIITHLHVTQMHDVGLT